MTTSRPGVTWQSKCQRIERGARASNRRKCRRSWRSVRSGCAVRRAISTV